MGMKFDIDEEDYMIGKPETVEENKDKENKSNLVIEKKKKKNNKQQTEKKENSFDFSKVFSEGEKGTPTSIKLNDLQKEVLKLTADALNINDGQSGIIREALDQYFQKLGKDKELKIFIETMLKYKKII